MILLKSFVISVIVFCGFALGFWVYEFLKETIGVIPTTLCAFFFLIWAGVVTFPWGEN